MLWRIIYGVKKVLKFRKNNIDYAYSPSYFKLAKLEEDIFLSPANIIVLAEDE